MTDPISPSHPLREVEDIDGRDAMRDAELEDVLGAVEKARDAGKPATWSRISPWQASVILKHIADLRTALLESSHPVGEVEPDIENIMAAVANAIATALSAHVDGFASEADIEQAIAKVRVAVVEALASEHHSRLAAEQEREKARELCTRRGDRILEMRTENETLLRERDAAEERASRAERRAQEYSEQADDGDVAAGVIQVGLYGKDYIEGRDSVTAWAKEVVAKLREGEARAEKARLDKAVAERYVERAWFYVRHQKACRCHIAAHEVCTCGLDDWMGETSEIVGSHSTPTPETPEKE